MKKSTWQFWQQLWNLSLHCEEFFKRQSFGSQHGSRRLHCWNELRHESSGNPTANLTNAVSGITPPEALDSCIMCAQIRGHSVKFIPFFTFMVWHHSLAKGGRGWGPHSFAMALKAFNCKRRLTFAEVIFKSKKILYSYLALDMRFWLQNYSLCQWRFVAQRPLALPWSRREIKEEVRHPGNKVGVTTTWRCWMRCWMR